MTKKFIKALSYDKRDIICNVLLKGEGNKGLLFKALFSQIGKSLCLLWKQESLNDANIKRLSWLQNHKLQKYVQNPSLTFRLQ